MAIFLQIAKTNYSGTDEDTVRTHYAELGLNLLEARVVAEKDKPAFAIAHSEVMDELILSIRGTKCLADVFTDLNVETEQFLSGYGHRGVVESAKHLHSTLQQSLVAHIHRTGVKRVVVTGHSLGGGCAAALTMLLRHDSTFSASCSNDNGRHVPPLLMTETASEILTTRTECFAFAPPPILDPTLAELSEQSKIITIVNGKDVVPRLSIRSVDGLMLRAAQEDKSVVGDMVRGMFSTFVQPVAGKRVSTYVSEKAIRAGHRARRVFGVGRIVANRLLTEAMHLVGTTNAGNPCEVILPGEVWHIDGPRHRKKQSGGKSKNEEGQVGELETLGTSNHVKHELGQPSVELSFGGEGPRLVRKNSDSFNEIEATKAMITDHCSSEMFHALQQVIVNVTGEAFDAKKAQLNVESKR